MESLRTVRDRRLRRLYAELAALLEESVLEHVERDGAPAPVRSPHGEIAAENKARMAPFDLVGSTTSLSFRVIPDVARQRLRNFL